MASFRIPDAVLSLGSTSFTTHAVDASNDGLGSIFIVPKTGTITKIWYNVTAKTGTTQVYRMGVEGTAAGRAPDGTYATAGTAYVDVTAPATGLASATLDASVSVTAGDKVAATIRSQSGVDASNYNTFAVRIANVISNGIYHPFGLTLTAGTWAASTMSPVTALQYDDGTIISAACPTSGITNSVWNSGSTPIYRGTKWTPGATCQCVGVWITQRIPDTANFTVHIYAGTASSPVVSQTVDADEHWGGNSQFVPGRIPIPATTLTSGTAYRFVIEPTTVNNQTSFFYASFADADGLAAFWGDLKGTTGVAGSPPTWTDYDNGTDGYRAYSVIPVIDDVTASSGGGGAMVIGG